MCVLTWCRSDTINSRISNFRNKIIHNTYWILNLIVAFIYIMHYDYFLNFFGGIFWHIQFLVSEQSDIGSEFHNNRHLLIIFEREMTIDRISLEKLFVSKALCEKLVFVKFYAKWEILIFAGEQRSIQMLERMPIMPFFIYQNIIVALKVK